MIYFTADTHFNHTNIIQYCKRPFNSVEEMDDTILDNINKNILPDDTLYHLGDFCFHSSIKNYRDRINCKNIHLILGNHDFLKSHENKLFITVSSLKEIKIGPQPITLSHYAMRVWNRSHYGAWNLFGHSHGTLPSIKNSFDVGVDCWKFCPLSIYQVEKTINEFKN